MAGPIDGDAVLTGRRLDPPRRRERRAAGRAEVVAGEAEDCLADGQAEEQRLWHLGASRLRVSARFHRVSHRLLLEMAASFAAFCSVSSSVIATLSL